MVFQLPLFIFGLCITILVMLGVVCALAELRAAHAPETAEQTDRKRPASGTSQG